MPAETSYSSNPNTGGTDQNAIGNPGGSIQEAMDASRNRLSAAYAAMQERSNQVLTGAEGYIQERPFQAVIYAASVGAVIGLVAGIMLGGGFGGSSGSSGDGSWHRRWW
jgi:ElaB/YqjD/DUF883 family membrane-anchored ribosome-binding protein